MTQLRASDVVAASIRDYRQGRGWSMAVLASRSGLSRDVISDIENGRRDSDGNRRRDITIDELIAIAGALEISMQVLLPARVRFSALRERQMTIAVALDMIEKEEQQLEVLERDQAALIDRMADERAAIRRYVDSVRRALDTD